MTDQVFMKVIPIRCIKKMDKETLVKINPGNTWGKGKKNENY